MAYKVTAVAQALSEKNQVSSNLIIEIEGVTNLYSVLDTYQTSAFDEGLYFDDGLYFDSNIIDGAVKPYISLSGTDSTIKQQLLQDKGSASSVTSFGVTLIDKNQEITRLISPGYVVDEILGRKAIVYLNFDGGTHPRDSMIIHRGIISEVRPNVESVSFTIAHSEIQKRQKIFIKKTTKLTSSITNSATSLTLDNVEGFILPTTGYIESYVKIGDELIRFASIAGNVLNGCERGMIDTSAASHNAGDDVQSFYLLRGSAVDLSLRLMLSQADQYWVTNVAVDCFGGKNATTLYSGMLYFSGYSIADRHGVVAGDTLVVEGSASNNGTFTVVDVDGDDDGSWIICSGPIVFESGSATSVVKFKSQFNTLTEGMGMTPDDVDVQAHIDIASKFPSSLPNYRFYLDDEITGKDFIGEQIYFPASLYSLPRKAKVSLGITIPPITTVGFVELNHTNITNISKLKTTRGINKNFYNAVVFKYNKTTGGDFVKGFVAYSGDSQTRIKNVGNKPLTIEADGLRSDAGDETVVAINSKRILDRFQYATESVAGVEVLFKDGYKIECGDIVFYGSEEMGIVDTFNGNRDFTPKLYEVVNKSLDMKTGTVSLDLLATGFDSSARYGSIGPSTLVATGSTSSVIKITNSFGAASVLFEDKKWSSFVGEKIRVHSPDYVVDSECTFLGFDSADSSSMLVSGLGFAPASGYIVELPLYATASAATNSEYKTLYTHLNPSVSVVSGTSQTVFMVSGADIGKFIVGQVLKIRSADWSTVSVESYISSIVGNTITVDTALGFIPSASQFIELIGFIDGGEPYRII